MTIKNEVESFNQFIDYINDIKPFHSKLKNVSTEINIEEDIHAYINDSFKMNTTSKNVFSDTDEGLQHLSLLSDGIDNFKDILLPNSLINNKIPLYYKLIYENNSKIPIHKELDLAETFTNSSDKFLQFKKEDFKTRIFYTYEDNKINYETSENLHTRTIPPNLKESTDFLPNNLEVDVVNFQFVQFKNKVVNNDGSIDIQAKLAITINIDDISFNQGEKDDVNLNFNTSGLRLLLSTNTETFIKENNVDVLLYHYKEFKLDITNGNLVINNSYHEYNHFYNKGVIENEKSYTKFLSTEFLTLHLKAIDIPINNTTNLTINNSNIPNFDFEQGQGIDTLHEKSIEAAFYNRWARMCNIYNVTGYYNNIFIINTPYFENSIVGFKSLDDKYTLLKKNINYYHHKNNSAILIKSEYFSNYINNDQTLLIGLMKSDNIFVAFHKPYQFKYQRSYDVMAYDALSDKSFENDEGLDRIPFDSGIGESNKGESDADYFIITIKATTNFDNNDVAKSINYTTNVNFFDKEPIESENINYKHTFKCPLTLVSILTSNTDLSVEYNPFAYYYDKGFDKAYLSKTPKFTYIRLTAIDYWRFVIDEVINPNTKVGNYKQIDTINATKIKNNKILFSGIVDFKTDFKIYGNHTIKPIIHFRIAPNYGNYITSKYTYYNALKDKLTSSDKLKDTKIPYMASPNYIPDDVNNFNEINRLDKSFSRPTLEYTFFYDSTKREQSKTINNIVLPIQENIDYFNNFVTELIYYPKQEYMYYFNINFTYNKDKFITNIKRKFFNFFNTEDKTTKELLFTDNIKNNRTKIQIGTHIDDIINMLPITTKIDTSPDKIITKMGKYSFKKDNLENIYKPYFSFYSLVNIGTYIEFKIYNNDYCNNILKTSISDSVSIIEVKRKMINNVSTLTSEISRFVY